MSPYLFITILNYAINRVATRMNIDLNYDPITLPMILAYADDILIVSDSIPVLEKVMGELIPELKQLGLEVNLQKCELLVRDPVNFDDDDLDHVLINGMRIKKVIALKYLGIYLTSTLDRRTTTAARIKAAYRTLYMLLPFLRKNHLEFETLLRIYHTVIVPTALYGIKVATLTKSNRISLKRMEHCIVTKLTEIAREKTISGSVKSLLKGKTIRKKCAALRLQYWGHVVRRPANHILRRALEFQVTGKYKRGRPCYTWHDSLKKDMDKARTTDWEDTVHDSKLHKDKCKLIFQEEWSDTDSD